MPQKTSPFLGVKYGWDVGEGGWNIGMDENLVKFSFMFDRNIDGIVESLPTPLVNGKAYFLTTDNRLYFSTNNSWYSSAVPKWFILFDRGSGQTWQFDGSNLSVIETPTALDNRVVDIEATLSTLGTAAFRDEEYFASLSQLDVASAQANSYTDSLRNDLSEDNGASLIGYSVQAGVTRTLQSKNFDIISVKDFGATGNGVDDDTSPIQAAIDYIGTLPNGGEVVFPCGIYNISATLNLVSKIKLVGYRAKIVSALPIAIQALDKDNIVISNLELEGPGPAVMGVQPEDGAINLGNIVSSNGCTDTSIIGCLIRGFYTGISVRYGNKCSVINNEVDNFTLYGVMLSRTQDFICSQNEIHGSVVTTGTNAYCISATGGSDSGNTQRRCSITDNKLYDVPSWSAIMSHDIADLIITGNVIDNARNGIDVSIAPSKSVTNIIISNNRIIGTGVDTWAGAAAANSGIFMATAGTPGVDVVSNVCIVGNVVSGFGRFNTGAQAAGAVLCTNVLGGSITGNILSQISDGASTNVAGIHMGSVCKDVVISGNHIRTSSRSPVRMFNLASGSRNILISGNNLFAETTSAAVLLESSTVDGLAVHDNNHNRTLSGYSEAGTNIVDGVSVSAPYGGRGVATKLSARVAGSSVTSLAAGATAALATISIPGVVVGDTVAVGYGAASPGVIVYGYVNGSGSVRVELYNGTGAALTKSAATVSVDVWKHS